jgi:hypothetical protein
VRPFTRTTEVGTITRCVSKPIRPLVEVILVVAVAVVVKGKGKFVPVLFNWAPRHVGLLGEWSYGSTSVLKGGEWPALLPGRFTPRAPGTHWIGGWVVPRVFLDAVVKIKIPSPRQESKPRTPIFQPVAQRYTDATADHIREHLA